MLYAQDLVITYNGNDFKLNEIDVNNLWLQSLLFQ